MEKSLNYVALKLNSQRIGRRLILCTHVSSFIIIFSLHGSYNYINLHIVQPVKIHFSFVLLMLIFTKQRLCKFFVKMPFLQCNDYVATNSSCHFDLKWLHLYQPNTKLNTNSLTIGIRKSSQVISKDIRKTSGCSSSPHSHSVNGDVQKNTIAFTTFCLKKCGSSKNGH